RRVAFGATTSHVVSTVGSLSRAPAGNHGSYNAFCDRAQTARSVASMKAIVSFCLVTRGRVVWMGSNARFEMETDMSQRLNLPKSNEGLKAMQGVEFWLAKAVDPRLLALVKMRASQINGCAYCLHMHSEEALKLGESPARLL